MRTELLYNPRLIIERLAEFSKERRRRKKLKHSPAEHLEDSQISSLEFLELAKAHSDIRVMYDLGGNAGTWSVLAHHIIPQAEIHAFEPVPAFQEQFKKNTAHIRRITLHEVAVGNDNRKEKFNIAGHSSSFLEVSETLLKMFPGEKKVSEIQVDMVRLDDHVQKNKIPYPDLIKLDIEGFEMEVLKNATRCLEHCRFVIIEVSFIERHIGQPLFHQIVQVLAENNFHLYSFPKRMHLAQPIYMADVMFKNTRF